MIFEVKCQMIFFLKLDINNFFRNDFSNNCNDGQSKHEEMRFLTTT